MVFNQHLHVVLGKNKCQGQFAESQLRPEHCNVLFLKQLIVSIRESWMGDAISDLHQAHPDARMIPLKVR